MKDHIATGFGIALMLFGIALLVATTAYLANPPMKINGRAVVLYVENGQPVAKWKEEAK